MAAEAVKEATGLTDDPSEHTTGENPDTLPTSRDRNGRCPRCSRVCSFDLVREETLRMGRVGSSYGVVETVTVLKCQGCKVSTAVIEETTALGLGYRQVQGVSWWPKPGHLNDVTDVLPILADAFNEGARCVGVDAPNAAVAMFRNALAQIVQDKGSDAAKAKGTLNAAIIQMTDDRTLHDGFKEWADHVRTVGNAGAHQEAFESIPIEQAEELMGLTSHLIDTLYIQPAKLRRAMPARKRPKPTTP